MKPLTLGVLAVLVAGTAWHQRDSAWVRSLGSKPASPAPISFDKRDPTPGVAAIDQAASAAPARTSKAIGSVRKCLRRGQAQAVYTDRECPPGTQEEWMTGGTVTVVAGQRAPDAPADGLGAAIESVRGAKVAHRGALTPEAMAEMKEKRIDRIVQQGR